MSSSLPATEVSVGEARRDGGRARSCAVTVTGAIDAGNRPRRGHRAGRRRRSARGRSAALADLGVPTVELWPGWVASVPGPDWRIDVRVTGGDGVSSPPSSASAVALSTVIGLDHGSRRIGVAVGDTETGMAFARPAILRRNLDGGPRCDRVAGRIRMGGAPRDRAAPQHGRHRRRSGGRRAGRSASGWSPLGMRGRIRGRAAQLSWEAGERLAEAGRRPRRESGELDSDSRPPDPATISGRPRSRPGPGRAPSRRPNEPTPRAHG